jgi:hypothetical protein
LYQPRKQDITFCIKQSDSCHSTFEMVKIENCTPTLYAQSTT